MEVLNLHSRAKNFSRNSDPKKNRSAVKAAAYRSGDRLFYSAVNKTIDYTLRARGIEWAQIILPENTPEYFADRATLWNMVEMAEKRKDSLLAREFELQIPREFTSGERINLVQEFVQANYVDQGMIVDFAIHDKERDNPNPHVHIMMTTRRVNELGFEKKKELAWDDYNGKKGLAKKWRKDFARRCNELYKQKNIDRVVEYRKFSELGIDRERTIHEGKEVTALEKKGVKTDVRAKNDAIRDRNAQRELDRQAESVIKEHSPNLDKVTQIIFDANENKQKEGLGKKILEATEKVMAGTAKVIEHTQEQVIEPVIELSIDPLADDVAKQFGANPLEPKLGDLSLPEIMERLGQLRGENKDLASLERLIASYDGKLSDLQHLKDNLTITTVGNSRWIDGQIKAVEQSREQAARSLKQEYNLDPSQIKDQMAVNQAILDKLDEMRAEMSQEREQQPEPTMRQEPEMSKDFDFDIDF